jgi:ATP-binding cassette, subfamily G (WHITE), member 2, PDR
MWPTSIQGVQNQIFSIFLLMIIFSNLTQLIMEKFVHNRALFEARERASKIYSWRVFLSSTIIAEIPSQSVIAVLVFVCWYYPIGMFQNTGPDTSERGALMFLLIWCYCIFTSTFSYMMVAGIEHASTAVNLAQLLYMLSLIFCG